MTHSNDEIEELKSLKREASERRAKRTSKKRVATPPPAGTAEEDGERPPPPSESEELVHNLTDQVETIFNEIGDASRERPVLALVSAFAVGVLIGHIFSKKQGQ